MDEHLEMLMNPRKLSDDEGDIRFDEEEFAEEDEIDIDDEDDEGAAASAPASDEGDDGDEDDEDVEEVQRPPPSSNRPPPYDSSTQPTSPPAVVMSKEEVNNAKRELLYRFDRLEKKGVRVPRKYSMASDLSDMQSDYDRLVKDRDADAGIRFQKQVLVAMVSGIEYLNRRFDPFEFHLDGWSETVNENLEDYDDVLEELHAKYRGKAKMAPELKLLMMLVGSAVMFHMTNTMFKSVPALGQVVKDNPDLMKHFAAATANTMEKQQGGGGGLASMLSGLFGGGGGGPSPPPPPPPQPQYPPAQPASMRGPSSSRIAEVQRFMQQGPPQSTGGIPNPAIRPPLPTPGRDFKSVREQPIPQAQRAQATVDVRGEAHKDEDHDLIDIMSAASSEMTTGGTRRKKRVTLEL